MIAVMVAKWVGDALEPEGIYDALIQLRKYPFLDARESYKGKSIMRDIMTPFERLKTINGSGMTIGELGRQGKSAFTDAHSLTLLTQEQLVADLKVTGFPVITDDSRRHVLGFICRSELLFVLKQARGNGAITSETRCTFLPLDGVAEQRVFGYGLDDWSPNSTSDVSLVATSSSEAINAQLNLRGWMDRTPMLVAPLLPVEIGLEVFRKMGVRYVLVNENARLEGIVTKKDLLEHMHSLKEE